ncbi:MAG: hypothetical protein ACTSQE_10550 [Candidatus Heimdallarchaeaceae archaeon]
MSELFTITVILHPSIPVKNKGLKKQIKQNTKTLEALIDTLSSDQEVYSYLVKNGDIRPGFLLLKGKVELRTTQGLEDVITEDLTIRIIPISHGG